MSIKTEKTWEEDKKEDSNDVIKYRTGAATEFLRWFFMISGVTGFIGWVGDLLSPSSILYGAYTYQIYSIPYVCIGSAALIIIGCIISAVQKYSEDNKIDYLYEMSGLTESLSGKEAELIETIKKLSKEKTKNVRFTHDLKNSRVSIIKLRNQVRRLDKERDDLDKKLGRTREELLHMLSPDIKRIRGIGPKTAEKLKEQGIGKAGDLLSVAPEDLSERIGVPTRQIAGWLEQATHLVQKSR